MKEFRYILLFPLAVLVACSSSEPGSEVKKTSPPWQTQLDALEKAKGVESQILKADQKRREQIEQMSQ